MNSLRVMNIFMRYILAHARCLFARQSSLCLGQRLRLLLSRCFLSQVFSMLYLNVDASVVTYKWNEMDEFFEASNIDSD